MFKTFLKGIVFGFGVIVAFLIAGFISSTLNYSNTIKRPNQIHESKSWHDLSDEEKIQKVSAVLILRYKPQKEGLMAAYVAEIHKKTESIEVLESIGDRRKSSDFYSRGGLSNDRDGAIIYMTGSPALERSTLYLYENRLAGAGDMPLNIFIQKFNASLEN